MVIFALAIGTFACAPPSAAPAPDTTPSTLRFGIAVPPTGSASTGILRFINNFVTDSIIGIGWDGSPVDRLVSDPEWTPDQLSLKLRLKPDLKFHDGMPIDRAYFRQRLAVILEAPQTPGTNVSYQSVKSVELDPESDDCIIIKLSRPEAFLLERFGQLVVAASD